MRPGDGLATEPLNKPSPWPTSLCDYAAIHGLIQSTPTATESTLTVPATIITGRVIRRVRIALAGFAVLTVASAFVSPQCEGHAIGWGQEFPTPVLTSAGEVCEIIEQHEDESVVISGYHDDFADYARWMLDQLTADAGSASAADLELIEYLRDCLSEKARATRRAVGGIGT